MTTFATATWAEIEALRAQVTGGGDGCVEETAQRFVDVFASAFSSVVLARLFVVVPWRALPPEERAVAGGAVDAAPTAARVLSLLGTAGRQPAWRDRRRSQGHRAIPLSKETVHGAPMLARLLTDLDVDLGLAPGAPGGVADGGDLQTRKLAGGSNNTFYVADARTARDAQGRLIIPGQDFVAAHGVQTVFGMGGAWVDGSHAVAILFTSEAIPRSVVDRFPSFIGTFKIATTRLVQAGALYRPTSATPLPA